MIIDIETVDPSTGYEVCVHPEESGTKRAAWILWMSPDGSGVLYTDREESGAVIGPGIDLPKNVPIRRGHKARRRMRPSQ